MFYSNSAVRDRAGHYFGPSSGSEDDAGGDGGEIQAADNMQTQQNIT